MGSLEERARRNLPGLRKWAKRLLALGNEVIMNLRYSEEDHLGFMSLCFLSKQIDHLQSIVALTPTRRTRATIVIRSSLAPGGELRPPIP
jgi:hypothetical protein